ncbi:unnamed protein product [Moneuplotes crassus]|uniref:FHA domain-containing protein n=1 Tax=Euplotes crassus TaxID=5936 RepID=A0AAD1U2C9_EUPCR|nr:unnamed protein product [Moneuplotes crassus]
MPLVSVVNIHDSYYLDNCFAKQSTTCYNDYRNCNWIPTIAYNNHQPYRNCHRLFEGDVIKFGRLVFEMRVLCTNPGKVMPMKHSSNIINNLNDSFERLQGMSRTEKYIDPTNFKKLELGASYIEDQSLDESTFEKEFKCNCRICLSGECDRADPLISICKCSGTAKYIHLTCAKELLKCKMKIKRSQHYISFTWESMICELCKGKLPDTVEIPTEASNSMKDSNLTLMENTKLVYLIDTPEEILEFPYIMMECLNVSMLKKNSSKIIYFIKMVEEKVIIGRGQAAQVRLADISISRQHTALYLTNNNEFYLTDHKSKFGTLILQKEPIKLNTKPTSECLIQSGRTLLNIRLRNVATGLCCCKTRAKNLQAGVNYFDHIHCFPKYFKRFIVEKKVCAPKAKKISINEVSKLEVPPADVPQDSLEMDELRPSLKKVNFKESNEESKSELEIDNSIKVKMNPLFNDNAPRLTETQNFSQPIQTFQDNDENNKTQKDLDREFRSLDIDDSDQENNDLEEECKDMVMDSQNFDKFPLAKHLMSPSPSTNKSPDFFLTKKGSLEMNSFDISGSGSPKNSFFYKNKHSQGMVLEQNQEDGRTRQRPRLRDSTEFGNSFKMLHPSESNIGLMVKEPGNKESSVTLVKHFTEENWQ